MLWVKKSSSRVPEAHKAQQRVRPRAGGASSACWASHALHPVTRAVPYPIPARPLSLYVRSGSSRGPYVSRGRGWDSGTCASARRARSRGGSRAHSPREQSPDLFAEHGAYFRVLAARSLEHFVHLADWRWHGSENQTLALWQAAQGVEGVCGARARAHLVPQRGGGARADAARARVHARRRGGGRGGPCNGTHRFAARGARKEWLARARASRVFGARAVCCVSASDA